jgi:hypothetical protein
MAKQRNYRKKSPSYRACIECNADQLKATVRKCLIRIAPLGLLLSGVVFLLQRSVGLGNAVAGILTVVAVLLGLILMFFVFCLVHFLLYYYFLIYALLFCSRNRYTLQKWKCGMALDMEGIKTESTVFELDCLDAEKQPRFVRLVSGFFGIRELLVDEGHSEEDKARLKDIKARLDAIVYGVHDCTLTGHVTRLAGGFKVIAKDVTQCKGIKYRRDVTGDGIKNTWIFDGRNEWILVKGAWRKQAEDSTTYEGPFWWRNIPDGVTFAECEKIGKRDCHVIICQRGNMDVVLWVDKENLRLIMAEGTLPEWTRTVSYFDYKNICGDWEQWHKSEQEIHSVRGGLGRTFIVEVTSVEVNTGLTDDLFDTTAAK